MLHKKDHATGEIMDMIIDLWTKMLEADAVHDDKICSNVETMQRRADEAVEILREKLARLHAIALTAVASAGGIAANELDLLSSLSKERLARADLQAQWDHLKVEHEKCLDVEAVLLASLSKEKLTSADLQAQLERLKVEQEKQLVEEKCKAAKLEADLKKTPVCA